MITAERAKTESSGASLRREMSRGPQRPECAKLLKLAAGIVYSVLLTELFTDTDELRQDHEIL